MMTLERYEIDPSPGRIAIRVNQKKNALVNMVVSAGITVVALYFLASPQQDSSFLYVLLVIGMLWLVAAVYGYRSERGYTLTRQKIEYNSSGRDEPRTLSLRAILPMLPCITSYVRGEKRNKKFPSPGASN